MFFVTDHPQNNLHFCILTTIYYQEFEREAVKEDSKSDDDDEEKEEMAEGKTGNAIEYTCDYDVECPACTTVLNARKRIICGQLDAAEKGTGTENQKRKETRDDTGIKNSPSSTSRKKTLSV